MSDPEGGMQCITLDYIYLQDAVKLYREAFQATIIHGYPDGSAQLKIYDSNIFVTSGTQSNSVVIELLTDGKSIRKIRGNHNFHEMDRESPVEQRSTAKMLDPFGVVWLLTMYQPNNADIYQHLDPCGMCNGERHLPATCDEMNTWSSYLAIPDLEANAEVQAYYALQQEMSLLRNLRFQYASEDIDQFTADNSLVRATFDELERINSFRQALIVVLFFNSTMLGMTELVSWKYSVEGYAESLIGRVRRSNSDTLVNNPFLRVRSKLADVYRQLVKRLQSARKTINKKKFGLGEVADWRLNPQEQYMENVLYADVNYWRKQKFE